MTQQTLSVSQISEYIRQMMDSDQLLSGIAVKGEISNHKVYPSGHHYFTLKDDNASLKCVMFKSSALRLRFRPDNGVKVIAIGKISAYPRDGVYQLYCTALVMDGIGDLYAAFEQLKAKLAAKGLFDQDHKKPIPQYPNTIGIVTSEAGAAIHDILRILKKRYPIVNVRLIPVRVQGIEAPGEIAAAIRYANHYKLADILIVGRGGGSIEDLWAFNDERVAYAIYDSEIPVISAVGHEPDVTISDFVADLRAATPSNAAELAVPEREALYQTLDSVSTIFASTLQRQLRSCRQQLRVLQESPVLQSPAGAIIQRRNALALQYNHLLSAHKQKLHLCKQKYISLTAKLDAMSPLKVLTRGYSMAQKEDGTVVQSVKHVLNGDTLYITVSDGQFRTVVSKEQE